MNTLFNCEAYLGCLQGTLTFEFHIYYKSMAQSSFLTHLFPIIVPSIFSADYWFMLLTVGVFVVSYINSFKKDEGVPLLNFKARPGVQLLNFEEGPGVALLNFREVLGSTFRL